MTCPTPAVHWFTTWTILPTLFTFSSHAGLRTTWLWIYTKTYHYRRTLHDAHPYHDVRVLRWRFTTFVAHGTRAGLPCDIAYPFTFLRLHARCCALLLPTPRLYLVDCAGTTLFPRTFALAVLPLFLMPAFPTYFIPSTVTAARRRCCVCTFYAHDERATPCPAVHCLPRYAATALRLRAPPCRRACAAATRAQFAAPAFRVTRRTRCLSAALTRCACATVIFLWTVDTYRAAILHFAVGDGRRA